LGIGVLGEVIKVLEYSGMGCIFLGLIVIDGGVLKRMGMEKVSRDKGNQWHSDSLFI
jgi:hypothetical protein